MRDPVEELAQQGANLWVNISASPYFMGKRGFRLEMLRSLARQYRMPVIFANQVGGNDSLVFDGSSVALDHQGNIKAQARSFEEDLVTFYADSERDDIHPQIEGEHESAFAALVLGTRDYVRKCARIGPHRAERRHDSSLAAAIAVEALGKENVLGVAMPGPYSSPGSLSDARALAENLGIRFQCCRSEPIFDPYLETLRPVFSGNSLRRDRGKHPGAHPRNHLLMACPTNSHSLVLSTGNKSELSVGYCTPMATADGRRPVR